MIQAESVSLRRRDFLKAMAVLPTFFSNTFPANDYIETVNGPISPKNMGMTLIHEHILVDFIGASQISASRWKQQEVIDRMLPYLLDIKEKGIECIMDCTPAYLGRDVTLLQKLSRLSGLKLITNTGYYGASGNKFLPDFAFQETAEQLAVRWTDEFRYGIEGTNIRPGFIKIGVDSGKLSGLHRKLITAAAYTHLKTGLTICSHTGPAAPALEEIDVLQASGVNASAFVWVHARGTEDEMRKLAGKGCWISLDGVHPDNIDQHVALLKFFKTEGFLSQILLSHDAGWLPNGGDIRGYTTIVDILIPQLRANGFDDIHIRQLMILNPATAFTVKVRKV